MIYIDELMKLIVIVVINIKRKQEMDEIMDDESEWYIIVLKV
jgi:hypothetical protein